MISFDELRAYDSRREQGIPDDQVPELGLIGTHGEGCLPLPAARRRAHTAAALPAGRIETPSSLSPDGLTVTFTEEGGERSRVFTFTDVEAPPGLVRPFVAAFAQVTGLGGSYRRMSSAEALATIVRRFAREIAAAYPGLTSIEEVDPGVWLWWYRTHQARTRSSDIVYPLRTLLRTTVGVRPSTLRALNRPVPQHHPLRVSYSRSEVARILGAARRVETATRSRLSHNATALAAFRRGDEPGDGMLFGRKPRSMGAILDHLDTHGCMPSDYDPIPRTESILLRQALRVGDSHFITALYPTLADVHALMIMFTYLTGLNFLGDGQPQSDRRTTR